MKSRLKLPDSESCTLKHQQFQSEILVPIPHDADLFGFWNDWKPCKSSPASQRTTALAAEVKRTFKNPQQSNKGITKESLKFL